MALLFSVTPEYVRAQAERIQAVKEATEAAKRYSPTSKAKAKAKAKKED
jgi:hypothetical protein